MNKLLSLTTLLLLGCKSLLAAPNIVFIYTDDQAPFAVNAAGDQRFITPHIDRIFHEGAHLKNSFVTTPVCSPARVGLLASRYGTEMGITDWINPGNEKALGLRPGTPTWPQLLSQAGYRNGLFGKWHLGAQDQHHPTKFGYDTFLGIRTGGCPPKNPVLELADGTVKRVMGYTCDIFTDHALEFIRQNQQRPFLVSLHFRAPHAAWLPVRPEDWEPFKDLDPAIPNPDFPNLNVPLIKKRTREYLAAVKSVDRNVGRLLALLEKLELAENTVVVFTSDHGYNLGEHGVWYKGNSIYALTKNPPQQWPKIPAARRPNLWDTSLRVPTAIRWPGVIKPGTTISQTISNLDWFPTLLQIAGVDVPAGITIHGHDFTPLLKQQPVAWDNDFYAEYSMHHGARTQMRGYRTPRWKLMQDFASPGRAELYDLVNDPHELTNLAASQDPQHARVRQELTAKLHKRMVQLKDPALKPLSRLMFGSCIKQDKPMPIFQTIRDQRPEMFIFLGDNIYADTTDMSVMKAKYDKLGANPGFAGLVASCPVLATWDDHDYGANDAGASYSKRVESQQIFADFWKLPRHAAARQRPGVYDAHIYGPKGQRTQVIILDTRYFRGPLKRGERRVGGPYYPTNDPQVTMLGEAQWKWLEQQLRMPAELRIIATSIQYIAESSGQETWSNIPLERARLFKLIKQTKANGIIMMSGDRHWAEIASLPGPTGYPVFDITSSSLNQPHGRGTPTINQYRAVPETYHQANFGTILVDWQASDPTIDLQIIDLDGKPRIRKQLKLSTLQADR